MVLQCRQCSSTALEKISESSYRCRYCGSVTVADAPGAGGRPTPNRPVPPRGLAVIVALVVLAGLLGGVAAYHLLRRGPATPAPGGERAATEGARPLHEAGGDAIEKEVAPAAEYGDVAVIPDVIGNVYFVGIYRNRGTVPVRTPAVTAVLFGADGRKVATGRGYAIREVLPAGEETPVVVLVNQAPRYVRYELTHTPERPFEFQAQTRPAMTMRRVAMARDAYGGWQVTGEIVNASRGTVKQVSVITVVLDANKKIIGTGTDYIREDALAPGDYSPFKISVSTVTGAPASCRLDYQARGDR